MEELTTAARVLTVLTIEGEAKIADLGRRLEVPRREVEAAVQDLALRGYPIATGSYGVRMARSASELAASNASLHHRLREQYRRLRIARRTERLLRERESAQPTLWP